METETKHLTPFPPAPRDAHTSAVYASRAHAYWNARANRTGDPDDVTAARAWERRTIALLDR